MNHKQLFIIVSIFLLFSAFLNAAAQPYNITGTWTFGPNGEKWTFTKTSPDGYAAKESGFGNAKGTAKVTGSDFRLDFTFAGGSGYFQGKIAEDGLSISTTRYYDGARFVFRRSSIPENSNSSAVTPIPPTPTPTALPSADSAFSLSGSWQFGPGGEYWTFTSSPDGTWQAQEHGFSNAKGIAKVTGSDFRLEFNSAHGSGYFEGKIAEDGQSISTTRYYDGAKFVFRRIFITEDNNSSAVTPIPPQVPIAQPTTKFSLEGNWQFGQGGEYWTFNSNPDGTYRAQEHGFGSAKGTAKVTGSDFRLDFTFAGGSGYFLGKIAEDGQSISTTRYHDGTRFVFKKIK
ncbi:MAG: hypothetical protein KKB51_23310 [Candidatus Riflebacteria bacterium]|nr:hypothetical protein [Candidatus Riflebacteria bacterium]